MSDSPSLQSYLAGSLHAPSPARPHIMVVYGTRPEAIKCAPVVRALRDDRRFRVTVAVTGEAQARFSAVDLAKAAVLAMGGQGAGGRPDFAQGGAPDGSKAAEGIAAVRAVLAG